MWTRDLSAWFWWILVYCVIGRRWRWRWRRRSTTTSSASAAGVFALPGWQYGNKPFYFEYYFSMCLMLYTFLILAHCCFYCHHNFYCEIFEWKFGIISMSMWEHFFSYVRKKLSEFKYDEKKLNRKGVCVYIYIYIYSIFCCLFLLEALKLKVY